MWTAKGRRDTPCAAPSRPLGDTCGVGGGVYHQAVCYELHIKLFLQRIPSKGSSFFDLLASVADYEYEQEIIQLVT